MSRPNPVVLVTLLVATACGPSKDPPVTPPAPGSGPASGPAAAVARAMDHAGFDALLRAHVSQDGVVDYQALASPASRAALTRYLESVDVPDPSALPRALEMRQWINIYNAATLDGVLAAGDIRSVKDVPDFLKKPRVKVGGVMRSLDDIEHGILRKMGDPRIHAAVNRASRSCPRLLNRAWSADSLDADLSAMTRAFLADASRNQMDGKTAKLSQIFEWFAQDFAVAPYGSVRGFVRAFGPEGRVPAGDFPIQYLDYDWALNGSR